MSYSDFVMWLWVLCLLGTLAGFSMVWRGIRRAEGALLACSVKVAASDDIVAMTAELDAATQDTAHQRMRLQTRVIDDN